MVTRLKCGPLAATRGSWFGV